MGGEAVRDLAHAGERAPQRRDRRDPKDPRPLGRPRDAAPEPNENLMHRDLPLRLATLIATIFLASSARGQEAYPSEYALKIDYDPIAGPRVHRPAGDFVFQDFRVGSEPTQWPLEVTQEDVAPTPIRPNVGNRIIAVATGDSTRPRRFSVSAHADQLMWEVGGSRRTPTMCSAAGSPPRTQRSGGARGSRPLSRRRSRTPRSAIPRPPPTLRMSAPPTAPTGRFPRGSSPSAPDPDGSRWLEWRVRSSADGEANAMICLVLYWNLLKTVKLPLEGIAQRAPVPPRSGWRSRFALGSQVSEKALLEEARAARAKLLPFGLTDFQIDSGWQSAAPDGGAAGFSKPDPARFPRGLGALAAELKGMGLRPGLEIVPQLSDAEDSAPGLLRTVDKAAIDASPLGRHLWDGSSPEGQK